MADKTFGFGEVLDLTGVSRSQLIYWTQAGLITAGVREAQGTGHHRVFSFHNLVEVAVAIALARWGVAVPTIRRVVTALTQTEGPSPGETSDQLVFVTGDPATSRGIWAGTLEAFVGEVQTAFLINEPVGMLINVGRIIRELAQRIGRKR